MWHALLHTLKDTYITLIVIFVCYIIIELVEDHLAQKLQKTKKWSPVFGTLFGLIPQCGFSVVATDLFSKKHLTMGTLIAVFIATSDEALPILLSKPDKILMILPLLAIKIVFGILVGYLVDWIYQKSKKQTHEHLATCDAPPTEHKGCCDHDIENKKGNVWKKYLLHPLIHTLKVYAYIFVVSFIFELLIYYIGADKIEAFLKESKYFAPLFAALIGLIPNCASSVIVSNLYISGGIGFGACVAGLIVNAGLGLFVLFKNNKSIKENFAILGVLFAVGLSVGYATSLICGFM